MSKPAIQQAIDYQEMIENMPAATPINNDKGEMIGMIHRSGYPPKFVATVVIYGNEYCMEFDSDSDDKSLDYSEAHRDAEHYAAKIIETNGVWEWEDLPKSAA